MCKKLSSSDRTNILNKCNGRCGYCGVTLDSRWHSSKIYMDNRDILDKYIPSCVNCNLKKGEYSIESFRDIIKSQIIDLNNNSLPYRTAKRFGLITENNIEISFYFETLK